MPDDPGDIQCEEFWNEAWDSYMAEEETDKAVERFFGSYNIVLPDLSQLMP
jgi:hypothetical protein